MLGEENLFVENQVQHGFVSVKTAGGLDTLMGGGCL